MVSKNMIEFARAIRDNDPDRAQDLIDEILRESGRGGAGPGEGFEKLPGVGPSVATEIQIHGYSSIESLAEASLENLVKIPSLREGRAKEVLESAREKVEKKLRELRAVGPDRAKEIRRHGYSSIESLAEASPEELAEIPKIGEKGARMILESAHERVGETIEDLPGVGPDRAKEIRRHGYNSIESLADASPEELVKIPSLREGRAKEVLESAKELRGEAGKISGYRLALEGAVSALEPERELTFPRKISEGRYTEEQLEKIKAEMESKASQEFRPTKERSFNEAWIEILEALGSIKDNGG